MLTCKSFSDLKPGCELEDFHYMFDHVCTPKIPAEVSGVARDFLKSCLAMRSCERLTAEKLLLHPFVVGQSHRKQLVIQRGRWFAHLQAMQMAPNQVQIVTQALPLFAEFCHHPVLRYLLLLFDVINSVQMC